MKTSLVSVLFGAMLALGASAPAAADTISNDYFLLMNFGDGLTQNAAFGDEFDTVGTDFVDNFLFNPDYDRQVVSFSFMSEFTDDGQQEVQFTGFSLSYYQPDGPNEPFALQSQMTSFSGSGITLAPLDGGVYVLQLTGKTLVDAAGFDGQVFTDVPPAIPPVPVPEPGSWALLAAGLGAVGLARRQRRVN